MAEKRQLFRTLFLLKHLICPFRYDVDPIADAKPGGAISGHCHGHTLSCQKSEGLTSTELGSLLGRDEVWVASLFYGQSTASAAEAQQLAEALNLDPAIIEALQSYPTKGSLEPVIPTDPLIYRFYEIMQVYGMPMKDVIQEKFGDGIMSAIDFTLNIDKVEDPAGDRVKVTMCGKFLPYKKW